MKAVILAAGLGSRLGADHPKGLLRLDGETLVGRQLRLLRERGIQDISMVVGHLADHYRQAFPEGVRFIENSDYATTGSLRSLLLAHSELGSDLLTLESDLVYEARALNHLESNDLILASGFTESGDEVFLDAPDGRLRGMSKQRGALKGPAVGEFVGLCRLSAGLLDALQDWGRDHPAAHYESDGMVAACGRFEIRVELLPDLIWTEVDDPHHWKRCQNLIWPRLKEREGLTP